MFPPHRLDPDDDLRGRGGWLEVRDAGPVQQARVTILAVAVDPLRRTLPRDPYLGSDMRDQTSLTQLNQAAASFHGQRALRWTIGRVFRSRGRVGGTSHPAAERPVPRLRSYQPSPTSCPATSRSVVLSFALDAPPVACPAAGPPRCQWWGHRQRHRSGTGYRAVDCRGPRTRTTRSAATRVRFAGGPCSAPCFYGNAKSSIHREA